MEYTYGGYVYDIENNYNNQNISESKFTNDLLDIARANLAKQIEVNVKDNAVINKIAVNGRTTITYASVTNFSTDLNIKLLETKVKYNSRIQKGYAFAYVNKNAAFRYYKNVINTFFNKISNSLTNAQNYIATGFKYKARKELKSVMSEFEATDKYFFWLVIFDLSQIELNLLLTRRYELEQSVRHKLIAIHHNYFHCMYADILGKPDNLLLNELKSELSKHGCNFTDNATQADWQIKIKATSRKYNYVS